MPSDIEVRNLSGQAVDSAALTTAAQRVLTAEGAELTALSLALVDDERISALNRRLLGRDGPTDVIAFEAEDGEGEIIISMDTAARQAEELGHSLMEELRFLVAHGVLHVCGWDDTDPAARQRMHERQHETLENT
ncbi:MAG: rRNA maturation RNase YbeY [Armatimonadetes bacterium]|nr:rRNA maturation RNase YbeY [Armatimonadota bacterium]